MTNIFLIRHFRTDWNATSRLQGRRDIALSETLSREEQARLLENKVILKQIDIECTLVSPLLRTQQTAQLHQAGEFQIWPDLIELDFGRFEGRTRADMDREFPGMWKNNPDQLSLGEDFGQFVQRVKGVAEKIARLEYNNVVIFGHGAWARCFHCICNNRDPREMNHLTIENGSLWKLKC